MQARGRPANFKAANADARTNTTNTTTRRNERTCCSSALSLPALKRMSSVPSDPLPPRSPLPPPVPAPPPRPPAPDSMASRSAFILEG